MLDAPLFILDVTRGRRRKHKGGSFSYQGLRLEHMKVRCIFLQTINYYLHTVQCCISPDCPGLQHRVGGLHCELPHWAAEGGLEAPGTGELRAGALTAWGSRWRPHPARCPGSSILPTAEGRRYTDLATGLKGLSKTSCLNPWGPGVSSPQMTLGALSRGVEMAEADGWL